MGIEPYVQQFPEFGLALRHHKQGRAEAARLIYLSMMDRHPAMMAICLHQLGVLAFERGDIERAIQLFLHVLTLDNSRIETHRALCDVLSHQPDKAQWLAAQVNLGCCLHLHRQTDSAMQVYRLILQHDPLNYPARVNLGTAYAWADELDQALYHLYAGICAYGRVFSDIGVWLDQLGQQIPLPGLAIPEGMPSGNLEKIEEVLTTFGKVLSNLSYPEAAIACHRMAIQCVPGFALGHWNLALALLGKRHFREGWGQYEWRWLWEAMPEPRRILPFPVWQGESLAGKRILVWAEQGSGDTIQFCPLVHELIAMAKKVVFEVPVQLVRLMQYNFPMIEVIGRPDHPHTLTTQDTFDYIVPLLSLPMRLGLDVPSLPLAKRYIKAKKPLKPMQRALANATDRVRVGFVWAGNPLHAEDKFRSLAMNDFVGLFTHDKISAYSFQVGTHALSTVPNPPENITDLSPLLKDFADTASCLAEMDLVISVDTGVAHLAAAMGKPVWILLTKVPDWRWGHDADTVEWYPSARLFRQTIRKEWRDVLKRVKDAMNEWVQKQSKDV